MNAAEKWAATQSPVTLPSGFCPSLFEADGGSRTDYGSTPFLFQFLTASIHVERFAKEATLQLGKQHKLKLDSSAIQSLAGKWLPDIYEKTFTKSFTVGRGTDGLGASEGIKFVVAALEAIHIRSSKNKKFSRHTIRDYVQKAKRTARAG